jgi:hypothetical protein
VSQAHCDLEVFIVSVALQRETNNVLETLHQSSVADTPLVLAVVGVDVRNKNRDSTVGLDLL